MPPADPPASPPWWCTGPLADLTVVGEQVEASLHVDTVTVNDTCLELERCVSGPGARRVLAFDTVIANIGCDDFFIGFPKGDPDVELGGGSDGMYTADQLEFLASLPDGGGRRLQQSMAARDGGTWGVERGGVTRSGGGNASRVETGARRGQTDARRRELAHPGEELVVDDGTGWSWHSCHEHWHYDNYAHYALRGLCTDETLAWEDRAVVGHKNGWCISDMGTYIPPEDVAAGDIYSRDACGRKYSCAYMGITAGCYDVYHSTIDCQWIDVTDVPDGAYWLTVATNWDEGMRQHSPPENDYTNNEANVPVLLNGTNVTVLTATEVAELCDGR